MNLTFAEARRISIVAKTAANEFNAFFGIEPSPNFDDETPANKVLIVQAISCIARAMESLGYKITPPSGST